MNGPSPAPFTFNAWKHHLRFLRSCIEVYYAQGPDGFETARQDLLRVGNNTLDIYTGAYSPEEIARKIGEHLKQRDLFDSIPYTRYIQENGGYLVLDLPDESRWVLREGDEPAYYIHIHPAKYVGPCRRFRANNIKTAVGVLARLGLFESEPFRLEQIHLDLVNEVRSRFPGLSPISKLERDTGPGELMRLIVTAK